MSEQIVITVHGSGIIGEPLHLRGEGTENCRTCHPIVGGPANLVTTHRHADLVATLDIDDSNIKKLAKRMGVVERILSDAIPLQPGEEGYVETEASDRTSVKPAKRE